MPAKMLTPAQRVLFARFDVVLTPAQRVLFARFDRLAARAEDGIDTRADDQAMRAVRDEIDATYGPAFLQDHQDAYSLGRRDCVLVTLTAFARSVELVSV